MAVLNLRKTMMAISLNAKLKRFVTNVELSQATILVVAELKMPLLAHIRREAIAQESANLPIEFKVLTTAQVTVKMTSL